MPIVRRSGFVCDLATCNSRGVIILAHLDPWPCCEECQIPLYQLPDRYTLTLDESLTVKVHLRDWARAHGVSHHDISKNARIWYGHLSFSAGNVLRLMDMRSVIRICDANDIDPDTIIQYHSGMQETTLYGDAD